MVDESHIQILLDRLYTGSRADWWQDQVVSSAKAFETEVLSHLYPFESDNRLEEKFYEMLDGREVLPAGLLGEYQELSEKDPLLDHSLLVPVTQGQFWRLRKQERLNKAEKDVWIAEVPYGPDSGLQLDWKALNESE